MSHPSLTTEKFAGVTWGWVGHTEDWSSPAAGESMEELAGLSGNWVTIAFQGVQENAQSTTIRWGSAPLVTDDDVRSAIRHAQQLGLKVCLKPVVNCASGTWRAHIGFFDADVPGEPTWAEWFAAYTEFILHYARIAETEGCPLFCIGCEMVRADSREGEWRTLIEKVRQVYSGAITYNCDKYQEDRLTWWDAVDVISSSGYYPAGTWTAQLDRIQETVLSAGKPFLFLEAGCPSREGSAARPNDWELKGDVSLETQDAYYAEMFAETAKRPWFGGFMLWDWPALLYDVVDAPRNDDYCPFAKPAAQRIRAHFTSMMGGDGR